MCVEAHEIMVHKYIFIMGQKAPNGMKQRDRNHKRKGEYNAGAEIRIIAMRLRGCQTILQKVYVMNSEEIIYNERRNEGQVSLVASFFEGVVI